MITKKRILRIFESFVESYINSQTYKHYSNRYKRLLELNGFKNKRQKGEDAYVRKWKALSSRIEPYSYRFFSHYLGDTPNIIPEDIGRIIERMLNPKEYRTVYADKNLFPVIIGKEYVPLTILCRINGGNLLDGNYQLADKNITNYLRNTECVFLKPSVNSDSGKNIVKFMKHDNRFLSVDESVELTKDYLMSYGGDFCLQEAVVQHDFMRSLCPSSINTIRLCVYRSVKDENPHVTASVIRIGKKGATVDNVHAGGVRIGVDVRTGLLGKYVVDVNGKTMSKWNDIDFSNNSLSVPNWHHIISFAEYVCSKIHYHRLLALDVAVERTGKPLLIEYNIRSFSYSPYMCTGQEVFGEYTDEIIEYCANHNKDCDKLYNMLTR